MAAKRQPRKRKKTGGRPPFLIDPANYQPILESIRAGAPYCHAVTAAGVSYSAFAGWCRKGRADQRRGGRPTIYVTFLDAVKRARAECVTAHAKNITEASKKSWQASAWVLERRFPDEFGDQRAEVRRLSRLVEQLLAENARDRAELQPQRPTHETPQAGPPGDPGAATAGGDQADAGDPGGG